MGRVAQLSSEGRGGVTLSRSRSVLRIKNQTNTLNCNLYAFPACFVLAGVKKSKQRSGPHHGQCVASQVKMERIQLEEEEWECETDLGGEFQDITSLLLQEPESSRGQASKQRPLWFWVTEHTKICIGAAFALIVLLLFVIYLTYSQDQLESTVDVMMEMPD